MTFIYALAELPTEGGGASSGPAIIGLRIETDQSSVEWRRAKSRGEVRFGLQQARYRSGRFLGVRRAESGVGRPMRRRCRL